MTQPVTLTIEISPRLAAILPVLAATRDVRTTASKQSRALLEKMATEAYDQIENPKFGRSTGITIAASTLLEQAEEKLLEAVMDALDKQDISSYSHLIENESEGDPD